MGFSEISGWAFTWNYTFYFGVEKLQGLMCSASDVCSLHTYIHQHTYNLVSLQLVNLFIKRLID